MGISIKKGTRYSSVSNLLFMAGKVINSITSSKEFILHYTSITNTVCVSGKCNGRRLLGNFCSVVAERECGHCKRIADKIDPLWQGDGTTLELTLSIPCLCSSSLQLDDWKWTSSRRLKMASSFSSNQAGHQKCAATIV